MSKTLKAKRVSYGLIELVDNESHLGPRYSIRVDSKVKEQSNDLNSLMQTFDRKYH